MNGLVLQAGRVLPMAAVAYQLANVRDVPRGFANNPIAPGSDSSALAAQSISRLQVCLFETEGEIIACARPRATYGTNLIPITVAAPSTSLAVPFVGRTNALFHFATSDGAGASYTVNIYGWRYHKTAQLNPVGPLVSWQGSLLVDATAIGIQSGKGATAFYSSASETARAQVAVQVAPLWDALVAEIFTATANTHVSIEGIVSGEL